MLRNKCDILAPNQRLEGGGGLECHEVLGPDQVGHLVRNEHVLVNCHLGGDGETVGVTVSEILKGRLHPCIQHLLPRFKPPKQSNNIIID